MIYKLVVPGTLDDVQEVRVLEWHAGPGTPISEGTLIVELETHKAVIEVRGAQAGVLRRRSCEDGAWCPLEGTLGLISDDAAEALPDDTEDLKLLDARFSIG